MNRHESLDRKVGRRAPLVAALCGVLILLGTIVTLQPWNDLRGFLGAAFGLFFLLVGLWYAQHPVLQDERSDEEFRREVDRLQRLIRLLHRAARREDAGGFERVRDRMYLSVDHLAGRAWDGRGGEEPALEGLTLGHGSDEI